LIVCSKAEEKEKERKERKISFVTIVMRRITPEK